MGMLVGAGRAVGGQGWGWWLAILGRQDVVGFEGQLIMGRGWVRVGVRAGVGVGVGVRVRVGDRVRVGASENVRVGVGVRCRDGPTSRTLKQLKMGRGGGDGGGGGGGGGEGGVNMQMHGRDEEHEPVLSAPKT